MNNPLTKENLHKMLQQLSNGLSSLFFPYRCMVCTGELNQYEDYFCLNCFEELHFTHFEKYRSQTMAAERFWGRTYVEKVFSLLYFQQGNSTQTILHKIKYGDGKDLAIYMGVLIGEKMRLDPEFQELDAIVPIPLHSKKMFARGYNQSALIAKGISEVLDIPVIELIVRTSHDESQTKKSKEERYENVKGKFRLGVKAVDYNHLLIVDDVLTTGATLEFATKAIKEYHANLKVSIATLALSHAS